MLCLELQSCYTKLQNCYAHTKLLHLMHLFQQCHVDDYVLFARLIPYVYDKFSNEAMGSPELMKLLTHSLDARQISDLVGEIIRENLFLFR